MSKVVAPTVAAWAPWLNGSRHWLLNRDRAATQWLVSRAHDDGSALIVQADQSAHAYRDHDGPIGALARAGQVATYKSPVGHGATFAHQADVKLLATAMNTAKGHALVVTELPTLPLHGWAMATGALNLSTGEVTVDTRTAEQSRLLGLFTDQLYSGWAHKQVGRRASAHFLPLLAESGMTYDTFVGSIIATVRRLLNSRGDIAEMNRALPPVWRAEAAAANNYDWWTHH